MGNISFFRHDELGNTLKKLSELHLNGQIKGFCISTVNYDGTSNTVHGGELSHLERTGLAAYMLAHLMLPNEE